MNCEKCKHLLSEEEIAANMCWKCGNILEASLISEDAEEAQRIIEGIEQEQKRQDEEARREQNHEANSSSEYGVISAIHIFFSSISVLAAIGGIICGILLESVLIALVSVLSISIFYCFFRVLIAITYLLCDIKEKSTSQND